VAVLDFGSNHIAVLIGDKSVNDTFSVKGYSKSFYAGFLEGEILEPEELEDVLCQTISTAESNAQMIPFFMILLLRQDHMRQTLLCHCRRTARLPAQDIRPYSQWDTPCS